MNLVFSDGNRLLATRYVSEGEESNSLYVCIGGRFYCEDGRCYMDEGKEAVLVVSEPFNTSHHWKKVNNNHLVMVDIDRKISVKPIEIVRD